MTGFLPLLKLNYISSECIPSFVCSFICCCCYCSVSESCLALCNPMDCSMSGFPILHYLPECARVIYLLMDIRLGRFHLMDIVNCVHFIVILLCISLITNDAEPLFMSFLYLSIIFGEIPIQMLCPFFNWVGFLLLKHKSSLY